MANPGRSGPHDALFRLVIGKPVNAASALRCALPDAKEAFMTTADTLRTEGKIEGKIEGRAETLIDLLAMKFGPLPQHALDAVHNATTEQLRTWTRRILTAESLEDALA